MNFNLCRHVRLAGSVLVFVGLYCHNFTVIIIANLIIVTGYMWSINKIERALEEKESEKE